jgi:hypothetical protein
MTFSAVQVSNIADVTVLKARDATLHIALLDPEVEGSTVLRNVKNCQTNGTASYSKRLKFLAILVRAHKLSNCYKNTQRKSHGDTINNQMVKVKVK